MPISLAQAVATNTSGGTTQLVVTPVSPFTNGNGLIVALGSSAADATSITDNNSVALSEIRTTNFFASLYASLWYLPAASGSPTSVKINFAGSTACQAAVYEVLGSITPNAGNAASANTTTANAGAFTTTNPNTIAVACLKAGSSITGQPPGYTLDLNAANFGAGYQVYTTVQTGINPTWANASAPTACCVEAFTSTNTGAALPVVLPAARRQLFAVGPWPFGLPVVPMAFGSPPAAAPHAPVPPVVPPTPIFPLALRLGLFRAVPVIPLPGVVGPPPVPAPPGPPPGKGNRAPFVRRQSYVADDRRDRRAADQLSVILNSLLAQGHVVQTGTADYSIRAAARTEARDPTSADDATQNARVGQLWLNTATRAKFMCVINDTGAAVWDPL